jgi:hypothetical protein
MSTHFIVTCEEPQPLEWYKTCNTLQLHKPSQRFRYSNVNGVVFCDCSCHKPEIDIIHMDACCNYCGVKTNDPNHSSR